MNGEDNQLNVIKKHFEIDMDKLNSEFVLEFLLSTFSQIDSSIHVLKALN